MIKGGSGDRPAFNQSVLPDHSAPVSLSTRAEPCSGGGTPVELFEEIGEPL